MSKQPEETVEVPEKLLRRFGRQYGLKPEMAVKDFQAAMDKVSEKKYLEIPDVQDAVDGAATHYKKMVMQHGVNDPITIKAQKKLYANVVAAIEDLEGNKQLVKELRQNPEFAKFKPRARDAAAVTDLLVVAMEDQAGAELAQKEKMENVRQIARSEAGETLAMDDVDAPTSSPNLPNSPKGRNTGGKKSFNTVA